MKRCLFSWAAVTLVFALSGCAANTPNSTSVGGGLNPLLDQSQLWKKLVGKWYGDRVKDGVRVEWVNDHKARGGYQITFRTTRPDGQVSETIEVGEWGASGPLYFTIFKGWIRDGRYVANDPADPFSRNAYKIISLTDTAFSYEHVTEGQRYTVKRVPDAFELPPLSK